MGGNEYTVEIYILIYIVRIQINNARQLMAIVKRFDGIEYGILSM